MTIYVVYAEVLATDNIVLYAKCSSSNLEYAKARIFKNDPVWNDPSARIIKIIELDGLSEKCFRQKNHVNFWAQKCRRGKLKSDLRKFKINGIPLEP